MGGMGIIIKYNQKRELPRIIIPYKDSIKKTINIYGDSFVFCPQPSHIAIKFGVKSWQYYLSQIFSAEIRSYGIGGAAESTILYCYKETHKENRDYTIIFHTHPERSDEFFNLEDLTTEDYEKWDKTLNIYPVLHIYWSKAKHYMFKNGKILYCNYWMDNCFEKNKPDIEPEDKHLSGKILYHGEILCNHMNDCGNFQLALDIFRLIKNELTDEYT